MVLRTEQLESRSFLTDKGDKSVFCPVEETRGWPSANGRVKASCQKNQDLVRSLKFFTVGVMNV